MVEEEPMFTPDEEQTMLKDDPEDLSQYAPASGDGCISLDSNSFEFFDELNLLNDNYCPLWADELDNGSPVDSLPNDSILLSSPEPHENDSSCEKSSLLTDLSLDPFDKSDIDNDAKSPFIPTIEDTPLTEPAVMWGALPENVSQAKPQPSGAQSPPSAPALQRLLTAPPTGPRPQDLISNIYSDQGLIPSRSISTWETGVKRTLARDEAPAAKRSRRSPSPTRTAAPSSSVLMNLLEQQARNRPDKANPWETNQQKIYQTVPTNTCNLPLPVINIVQNMSKNQLIKSNTFEDNSFNMANLMTPLTLNVDSPMYSMPASPNTTDYSPAMSPARMDYVASNYSTPQSLSPAGKYQTFSPNSDPYLNKMQLSPNYELQPNFLLDHDMTPTDFCIDLGISVPNDLLSEIDELRV